VTAKTPNITVNSLLLLGKLHALMWHWLVGWGISKYQWPQNDTRYL